MLTILTWKNNLNRLQQAYFNAFSWNELSNGRETIILLELDIFGTMFKINVQNIFITLSLLRLSENIFTVVNLLLSIQNIYIVFTWNDCTFTATIFNGYKVILFWWFFFEYKIFVFWLIFLVSLKQFHFNKFFW